MHFFENNRVFTGQSSAWYFEKINIRRLKDCSLIKEYLLDFFHNKQLTDRVGTFILKTSGGHQGLIRETLQHIFEKWESINFDTIEEEIQQFISDTTIIDEFRADYTSLNTEDLQLLYSFRNKKLFETNEGELVRKFVSKGILTREGDLYISISPGIIGDILKTIYQTRTMAASKKLVLCVHGLAGSEQTWRKFEELYKSDRALQQEYDFATFEYPTSKWWNFNLLKATNPAIKQLADGLDTEIKFRHNTYKEIALVCHSMGGLVGRKYLLDKYLLKDGTQAAPTIKKIIMYATPHLGSSLANIAKYITIRNNQVKQLARNSDFLGELNDKWISTGALDHYKGWYVIGGLDQIVPKDSSQLYYGNKRCQTILNADHFNCNSHYLIGQ
jgi:predicted alpha/beta hydrolase family esterase